MVISYQAYWFFISDINFFSDIPMLWVIPLYWIIHPMACLVSFTFWSTPVLSSSSFFTLTITRWSSFQRWSDSVMINWSTQHQAHSCPDYLPIPVSLAHITYHYHQHYWYISYHPCSPYPPILVTGIAPLCHALPSVRQSQSTRRGGQSLSNSVHCSTLYLVQCTTSMLEHIFIHQRWKNLLRRGLQLQSRSCCCCHWGWCRWTIQGCGQKWQQ